MYDVKWIRDNAASFDEGLRRRRLTPLSAAILALDDQRRTAIGRLQAAQERRNATSREIGVAMARKDGAAAEALKAEMAQLKADVPALELEERAAKARLDAVLAEVPNQPLADVPDGASEADNVVLRSHGAMPVFPADFTPREHFDIGERLGMDFDTAAKLSGARFVVLRGDLARLERALGAFMLDLHTAEHGYTEVSPPLLVRDDAMFGTAQLPKFADDQFAANRRAARQDALGAVLRAVGEGPRAAFAAGQLSLEALVSAALAATPAKEDLWLIPTAEVSLTNLVRDSILEEADLPLRFTACTPSFRAEAGAAGRDTRGMIRQHQFIKVELVSITTPDAARAEHDRMTACAERCLERLGLPYRTVVLCTGDMGFASQKTYDIEVWMPGQGDNGAYREISSCSVCGEFQARRMDARSRGPDGKPRFVHTLNGSGTAVGRALIAVMETYQQQGGSIAVPDVLQPYMGGLKVVEKDG
jgi:seryl-tRNA synthetase